MRMFSKINAAIVIVYPLKSALSQDSTEGQSYLLVSRTHNQINQKLSITKEERSISIELKKVLNYTDIQPLSTKRVEQVSIPAW